MRHNGVKPASGNETAPFCGDNRKTWPVEDASARTAAVAPTAGRAGHPETRPLSCAWLGPWFSFSFSLSSSWSVPTAPPPVRKSGWPAQGEQIDLVFADAILPQKSWIQLPRPVFARLPSRRKSLRRPLNPNRSRKKVLRRQRSLPLRPRSLSLP